MFTKIHLIALTLVLGLAPAIGGQSEEAVAPHTLYLVGEVSTTNAEGKWLDSSVYLIQRRVIPNESRIEISNSSARRGPI